MSTSKMCKRFYTTDLGIMDKITGEILPDEEWFVFRASDICVDYMLEAYIKKCKFVGGSKAHIDAIQALLDRVRDYQRENPRKLFVD